MRCLIAVSSCWDFEQNGSNTALRETWLADVQSIGNLDYKIFVGHGQGAESSDLPSDVVLLPEVDDGYGDLSKKTQCSLRWAAARDYDFVFRCFPDTYCRPERLIDCGFTTNDFHGDFRREHCGPDNYASGGPGYFLSRRAFELLLGAPIKGVYRQVGKPEDDSWISDYAEDLWVGQILNRHRDMKLRYFDDQRFINHGTREPGPLKSNSIISTHLSCPDRYAPERMWEKHSQWLRSL